MKYEELVRYTNKIFASMPSPEEFARMVHDAKCPLDQVGVYKWEGNNEIRLSDKL
jgi:hypothetical protein